MAVGGPVVAQALILRPVDHAGHVVQQRIDVVGDGDPCDEEQADQEQRQERQEQRHGRLGPDPLPCEPRAPPEEYRPNQRDRQRDAPHQPRRRQDRWANRLDPAHRLQGQRMERADRRGGDEQRALPSALRERPTRLKPPHPRDQEEEEEEGRSSATFRRRSVPRRSQPLAPAEALPADPRDQALPAPRIVLSARTCCSAW